MLLRTNKMKEKNKCSEPADRSHPFTKQNSENDISSQIHLNLKTFIN